ncbi:DUF2537 domain-containing protein [Nocardia australiensis]|uniref:DUF2537 domain-containing protein n=1 Tax=Nocardia australiensis TaxID=2887191 RepID=UPI001D137EA1|nr:DUF2537 domain-containing protein [Nocardia australiensis]
MSSYLPNGAYRPYQPYHDPTPWAAGLTVAGMVAVLTAVAVYSFGDALAQVHPLLAVVVNLIAAIGVAPTAWRWRNALVTRWIIAGGGVGVLLGWVALVIGGLAS